MCPIGLVSCINNGEILSERNGLLLRHDLKPRPIQSQMMCARRKTIFHKR